MAPPDPSRKALPHALLAAWSVVAALGLAAAVWWIAGIWIGPTAAGLLALLVAAGLLVYLNRGPSAGEPATPRDEQGR